LPPDGNVYSRMSAAHARTHARARARIGGGGGGSNVVKRFKCHDWRCYTPGYYPSCLMPRYFSCTQHEAIQDRMRRREREREREGGRECQEQEYAREYASICDTQSGLNRTRAAARREREGGVNTDNAVFIARARARDSRDSEFARTPVTWSADGGGGGGVGVCERSSLASDGGWVWP